MLETIIVLVVVALSAAGALALRAYRRFMRARDRLLAHLRATAPDLAVRHLTDTGVAVEALGIVVDVDLASLLRARPPRLAEARWFEQILDGIRARVPAPAPPPLALVRDRIVPLLKPLSYLALFDRYPPAVRPAWRPFVEDAAVAYVIPALDRRTSVTLGMLDAWALEPTGLHEIAVTNLRRHTAHILAEIGGPRARYEDLDGFDATRILVADLVAPPDIQDPIIAIPEETVLLIAPASARRRLEDEAAARHAASTRPLTRVLFRLCGTGPVPIQGTTPVAANAGGNLSEQAQGLAERSAGG
jgi:hypothetical protein